MTHRFRHGLILVVFTEFVVLLTVSCSRVDMTSEGKARIAKQNLKNRVRFEHVALNVKDPVKMAEWYCQNLGMKIVRKGPAPVNMRFISDAGGNMMFELYNNPPDAVPDYASIDPLLLHIAFMVDDVKAVRQKLIAAGATPVAEVSITPAGDEIAMLRDPWGIAIQFVKRAEPMLKHK